MTDTPRTDAAIEDPCCINCGDGTEYVPTALARDLERAISDSQADRFACSQQATEHHTARLKAEAYAVTLRSDIGYLLPLAREAASNEPACTGSGFMFKRLREIEERLASHEICHPRPGASEEVAAATANGSTPDGVSGSTPPPVSYLHPSEFAIYDGEEYYAEVFGERERVWGEAMHYAMQCDKPRIEEIVRTMAPMGEVPPGALFPENAVGPGFVAVPVEPTPEMLREATNSVRQFSADRAAIVYRAMLRAAPSRHSQDSTNLNPASHVRCTEGSGATPAPIRSEPSGLAGLGPDSPISGNLAAGPGAITFAALTPPKCIYCGEPCTGNYYGVSDAQGTRCWHNPTCPATGLDAFTDAEVNAEFKRRNQPPPNPQAPTMKEPR